MAYNEDIMKKIEAADTALNPPEFEPERQYYFIKRCREIVSQLAREKGRPLFACTVNMGCQMNTVLVY